MKQNKVLSGTLVWYRSMRWRLQKFAGSTNPRSQTMTCRVLPGDPRSMRVLACDGVLRCTEVWNGTFRRTFGKGVSQARMPSESFACAVNVSGQRTCAALHVSTPRAPSALNAVGIVHTSPTQSRWPRSWASWACFEFTPARGSRLELLQHLLETSSSSAKTFGDIRPTRNTVRRSILSVPQSSDLL
jgi:hypothetical protein